MPETLREAIDLGYKPVDRMMKYVRLGDCLWMSKESGDAVVLMILSAREVHDLGLRFPYERFGQWNRSHA